MWNTIQWGEQVRPIVETASFTLCISERLEKIDVGVSTTKLSLTCKRARIIRYSHADVRMATSSRQTCRCLDIVEAKPQDAVNTSAPTPRHLRTRPKMLLSPMTAEAPAGKASDVVT